MRSPVGSQQSSAGLSGRATPGERAASNQGHRPRGTGTKAARVSPRRVSFDIHRVKTSRVAVQPTSPAAARSCAACHPRVVCARSKLSAWPIPRRPPAPGGRFRPPADSTRRLAGGLARGIGYAWHSPGPDALAEGGVRRSPRRSGFRVGTEHGTLERGTHASLSLPGLSARPDEAPAGFAAPTLAGSNDGCVTDHEDAGSPTGSAGHHWCLALCGGARPRDGRASGHPVTPRSKGGTHEG
jgi:hypothetical protein